MANIFLDKVIIILSPQAWNHLHISKHHYARALARNNKVYFISAPSHSYKFAHSVKHLENGLFELEYTIPGPYWLRFKFLSLYKLMIRFYLPRALKKVLGFADFCFDFGCYRQFDSVEFIPAVNKIYFPVDDFSYLRPENRGSDLILTVSKNIQRKYPEGSCHFINHGLSEEFSMVTIKDLKLNLPWVRKDRVRVCYAGNLFSRFMDQETFKKLIVSAPIADFHFFGDVAFNPSNKSHVDWNNFLRKSANVFLHGQVSTAELAENYNDIDVFLLCYKPDNVDFHGENSHKILEYLSTGKVIVSSFIYVYEKSDLIVMPDDFSNATIVQLFSKVIADLPVYNSVDKMNARREFALRHTYRENINLISELVTN